VSLSKSAAHMWVRFSIGRGGGRSREQRVRCTLRNRRCWAPSRRKDGRYRDGRTRGCLPWNWCREEEVVSALSRAELVDLVLGQHEELERLQAALAEAEALNARLEARVRELETRLGLRSPGKVVAAPITCA
jgi:hypothetical protein